jgi:hypothetical protein
VPFEPVLDRLRSSIAPMQADLAGDEEVARGEFATEEEVPWRSLSPPIGKPA